jgi:type IX secretion system PorP/SprF family membrane protein
MKNTIYLLLMAGMATGLHGQQLPSFAQFYNNDYVLNPAIGGTKGYYDVKSAYRYQWVGIQDAPRTFTLAMNGPIVKEKMGIGGYIYSDVTGPTRRTGAKVSYSYIFKLTETIKMSFGLAGGIMQYVVDGTEITLKEGADPAQGNTLRAAYTPDAAFGAYLYHDNFYVSVSVPQLIGTTLKFYDGSQSQDNRLRNHYYFNAGYKYKFTDIWAVEPFVQLKYAPPAEPQLDAGARVIWSEKLWLGGIYRTQESATVFVGTDISDSFVLSYAYDLLTNNLQSVSSGSHEILIGFKFRNAK